MARMENEEEDGPQVLFLDGVAQARDDPPEDHDGDGLDFHKRAY